ncbi:MAG: hypothetical protein NVS3B20_19100 [Polyangiales bacterium]
MKHSPFDPRKAVTFDLSRGVVHFGVDGEHRAQDTARGGSGASGKGRALIVPAIALVALAQAAGEAATRELGRSLGRELGARVAQRTEGSEQLRGSSIEVVAAALAAEMAVVGLGELSFEGWGKALLAVVYHAPEGAELLVSAVIEGLLSAATGRELRTLPLSPSSRPLAAGDSRASEPPSTGAPTRILIGNVATIERVIGWLGAGVSWGEAITRLHAPREGGAPS